MLNPFQTNGTPPNFFNSQNYLAFRQNQQTPSPFNAQMSYPNPYPVQEPIKNICCVEQDQHRKIFDTFTSRNYTYPQHQGQEQFNNFMVPNYYPPQQFYQEPQAQQSLYYNPMSQINPGLDYYQQTNFNQLQDKAAVELVHLQNLLRERRSCFELKLHLDRETSTSDLQSAASKLRPDFKNAASALLSQWPYWLQADPPNQFNHKQLIIKNTERSEGQKEEKSASELLEEFARSLRNANACPGKTEKSPNCCVGMKEKRISFADDVNDVREKDAASQIHICCNCCKHSSPSSTPEENSPQPSTANKENTPENTTDSTEGIDQQAPTNEGQVIEPQITKRRFSKRGRKKYRNRDEDSDYS